MCLGSLIERLCACVPVCLYACMPVWPTQVYDASAILYAKADERATCVHLTGHASSVTSMVELSERAVLVSGGSDRTLRLWTTLGPATSWSLLRVSDVEC